MARLYYQIYWDDRGRLGFSPEEYAAVVRVLAQRLERLERQPHQLRLVLAGDVEVKLGYSAFIQVSSPSPERTAEVWGEIRRALGLDGDSQEERGDHDG